MGHAYKYEKGRVILCENFLNKFLNEMLMKMVLREGSDQFFLSKNLVDTIREISCSRPVIHLTLPVSFWLSMCTSQSHSTLI